LVLVAEIQDVTVSGQPKEVEKPLGIGGPMVPRIPLQLAKISARTLLTLRGTDKRVIDLYSWFYAAGKHGGPRLFHPGKRSVHILFLKEDSGYLHMVCDYPHSDLEISSKWCSAFLSQWRAGYGGGLELPERIVAVRLKAEWESSQNEASEYWRDCYDLAELASPAFLIGQLDLLCHNVVNPLGRSIACSAYAEQSKDYW